MRLQHTVEAGERGSVDELDRGTPASLVDGVVGLVVPGVGGARLGGTAELAHDVAVHVAFAKPPYVRREDVPEADVAEERATLESVTRAEGKPEAALEKIVEGRLTGWFKERVLLDQGFVKDDKVTIGKMLGGAGIVSVSQVVVGG